MSKLRKDNLVLVYGDYQILQAEHPTVYAYTRTYEGEQWLVLLNFSASGSTFTTPELGQLDQVKINNYEEVRLDGKSVELLPYQAVIYALK
jgi:oligo-1,6-glucosidase